MKKYIFTILMVLLVGVMFVNAAEDFTAAKTLIDSKVSCEQLNDSQLETIGDYYMELIHPGDAHEYMDNMMGGEGSESLRLMHINMGRRFYCNDNNFTDSRVGNIGMMGTGIGGYGMMGQRYAYNQQDSPQNYGMMSFYNKGIDVYDVLYIVLLIGLIILIYLAVFKLWKADKVK